MLGIIAQAILSLICAGIFVWAVYAFRAVLFFPFHVEVNAP